MGNKVSRFFKWHVENWTVAEKLLCRMHILEIQQNKLDKLFFDFYRDSSQSDVSWKAVPLYAVLHCRLRGALAIKT